MEIIDVEVLGHTLRAPRDEAEVFAAKVADLVATAAKVPDLLTQLDEVHRRHALVERDLGAIRAAAAAASSSLREDLAPKRA